MAGNRGSKEFRKEPKGKPPHPEVRIQAAAPEKPETLSQRRARISAYITARLNGVTAKSADGRHKPIRMGGLSGPYA